MEFIAHENDTLMEAAQRITQDELVAQQKKVGPCNERGYAITGFVYPPDHPLFYVKARGFPSEAATQQFVYDSLRAMSPDVRQGISVPRIYRTIPYYNRCFIIMELIRGTTLRELCEEGATTDNENFCATMDAYYARVSQGLQLLVSLPPHVDATPGPVGGGYFRHPLFADFDAPMKFDSIDMLERYVNQLATWFSKTDPTATLERKLVLVFSDLHMGNFIFTEDGGLCIIDFADAAFLPPTFLTYTLHCPKAVPSIDVAAAVRKDFDLPMENLQVMRRISQLTRIPVYKLGFRRDQDRRLLERAQEDEAQKKAKQSTAAETGVESHPNELI